MVIGVSRIVGAIIANLNVQTVMNNPPHVHVGIYAYSLILIVLGLFVFRLSRAAAFLVLVSPVVESIYFIAKHPTAYDKWEALICWAIYTDILINGLRGTFAWPRLEHTENRPLR